jgi:tetratricopeptide (TPR) repeat protein
MLGAFKKAINFYQKSLKFLPNPIVIYEILGELYFIEAQYQDAIKIYQKLIKISPKNHEYHYYLGIAYYTLSTAKKPTLSLASSAFKHVITLKKDYYAAYVNLFELNLIQNHNFDKKYLKILAQNPPKDLEIRMNLDILKILYQVNRTQQSIRPKQQKEFLKKYVKTPLKDWSWDGIEMWINAKKNNAHLHKTLKFFKNFETNKQ